MGDPRDLERRLAALEAIEAIRQLKYRYWRHLDCKQWDELAQCFTPDAEVSYGDGQYEFQGVERIIGFLRGALGVDTGSVTIHHGHHPEIQLTGDDTASGSWALYNYMYNVRQDRGVRIGAYYQDDYLRLDGGWRIRRIGYRTLFHEEWKRSDMASLQALKG